MSQTLQNQITYAKSMNGIITLSDGMGTTIQNGQVVTLDLCGNTVTANSANMNSLSLNDIDLNGSLTVEAINDIPYSRGNVSLWNKGNTWLANAVAITGDLYTSGQNIFDASYQAITIVNGDFMDPVRTTGTTTLLSNQTNTTPNFSALNGWGFFSATAKNYNIKIQKGLGGTYYFTYFPGTANQALILETTGITLGSVSAQTQNYTLTSGIYTFAFYLQHNSWCIDSRIFTYVYTSTGVLLTSLSNLNVSGSYPNWVQYKMNFTLTATTDIYFIIKETTINTATSEYVAVYGCTLQQTEITVFKDNNLVSGIGGSGSILNNLVVNNSAYITGGGTIVGGLTIGSTLGLNNTPINSKMNNANNSYNIAIGNGVLDNLTNGQRNTVVGDGACALNVTTSSDVTAIGYGTYILNNESRSTYIGSYISSRSAQGMNSCVGFGIGGGPIGGITNGDLGQENAIVGYYNLTKYNGFGSLSPSQNSIVGALSCNQLGDSYNSCIGYKTFNIMTHTAGTNTTRYNSAIGAFAGDSNALYNYCTLLGANTDTNASGLVQATAVGANTIVSSSYTIQLGSNSETVNMSGPCNITGLTTFSNGAQVTGTFTLMNDANGYAKISDFVGIMMKINSATSFSAGFGYNVLKNENGAVANNNSAFGSGALNALTTGSNNTACGQATLTSATGISQNTAIGSFALQNTTSNDNVAIGFQAGTRQTTGTQNIFIGSLADFPSATQYTNSVCIGYNSRITANNTVFLGTSSQSCVINSAYINTSSYQTGNFTVSYPVYPTYSLAPSATMTITLPTASATYDGVRILFKRVNNPGTIPAINSASSNILNLTNTATAVIMSATNYVCEIICQKTTGTTYSWYYTRAPV